jgi:hypothetical protein
MAMAMIRGPHTVAYPVSHIPTIVSSGADDAGHKAPTRRAPLPIIFKVHNMKNDNTESKNTPVTRACNADMNTENTGGV